MNFKNEAWRNLLGRENAEYRAMFDRVEIDYAKRRKEQEEMLMRPSGTCAIDKQYGGTHYKDMGIEPWSVVDTWPIEQQIGYYRGGALKYVMRLGTKDAQLQEARKAGHYIEKLIEVLEHANST